MSEEYEIPVGFHFRPTDQELIELLKQKARGQTLETDQVVEKILSGDKAMPWDVFSENDHWQSLDDGNGKKKPPKEFVYVLVKLSKMSAKKTARTAGCGTWDGQTAGKPVKDNGGRIIGFVKMLNFALNPGCSPEAKAAGKANGYWIMHEFFLPNDETDYVICRIIRDYSKYTKEKATASNKRVLPSSQEQQEEDYVLGKRKSSGSNEDVAASKICRKDFVDQDLSIVTTQEAVDVAHQGMELPNFLVNPISIEDYRIGSHDDLWSDGQQITYSDFLMDEGLQTNGIFQQESVASESFYYENYQFPPNSGNFFDLQGMGGSSIDPNIGLPTEQHGHQQFQSSHYFPPANSLF